MGLTPKEMKILERLLEKSKKPAPKPVPLVKLSKEQVGRIELALHGSRKIVVSLARSGKIRVTTIANYLKLIESGVALGEVIGKKALVEINARRRANLPDLPGVNGEPAKP